MSRAKDGIVCGDEKFSQRAIRENYTKLPSSLQLTELLLFLEELREIWEWLWLWLCEGLESAERLGGGNPPNGLGVTVTSGWTDPAKRESNHIPFNSFTRIAITNSTLKQKYFKIKKSVIFTEKIKKKLQWEICLQR